MEVKAYLRHLRISPRKVRLVVDIIRGMGAEQAQTQLEFINKRATEPVLKLLNSALANAEHNFNLEKENLYISKIFVDEGATLKRARPRAMGRSAPIRKRTSHITVILDEKVKTKEKSNNSTSIKNSKAKNPKSKITNSK